MDLNKVDKETIKGLIQQATQYLSEAELMEEYGWSEKDVEILEAISQSDFNIHFK